MAGGKSAALYTSSELIEIKNAVGFFQSREQSAQDLYDEVAEMGSLGLWWDKRVPTSDKGIFNFVSLKSKSEIPSMQVEIQKHKNFFESTKNVLLLVEEGNEITDTLIIDLYTHCEKLETESSRGRYNTSSSTLHSMYSDFLAKKKMLESEIKKVECIVVRKQLNKAVKGWNEAKEEITKMNEKMDDALKSNQALSKKVEDVVAINKTLTDRLDRVLTLLEQ